MDREQILPGLHFTQIPVGHFKRCRLSLNFLLKGRRETATLYALLPMLMERGYADCPDMTRLSIRLAELYGADLSVSGGTLGPNRVISVSVSGIKNQYAVEGGDLESAYMDLLFGVAFRPDIRGDGFDPEGLAVEKDKLKELLESEINEKRLYCLRQARRRFYGDDVAGLERNGYLDEVDGITPQALYAAYRDMVAGAEIEVVSLGFDGDAVKKRLAAELTAGRCRVPLNVPHSMPVVPMREYTEPMDTVQGKLCLLFTLRRPLPDSRLSAMRMAIAMLGGTATSRLFMNVREKQSLCYYCSAAYSQLAGCLSIDSGVEHENAEKTKKAILKEIEKLLEGPIAESEMEATRRSLVCALESVGDSLSGLENWAMGEISRGTLHTPEEIIGELRRVTVQDVRDSLALFSLSVVYTLTKKEGRE